MAVSSLFGFRSFRTLLALGLLAAGTVPISGCGFLASGSEKVAGKEVNANYTGFANKTVAIVIYADWATSLEYVSAREEIANFVTARFHELIPSAQVVPAKLIIAWQDDTREWQGMPVKDIGKHFNVDRVLYLELLDYRTREPGARNLMRGRIHAMARVFEIDSPNQNPVWEHELDSYWPAAIPENDLHGSDVTVRRRVLEAFSDELVGNFYDRREYEKSIREREEAK